MPKPTKKIPAAEQIRLGTLAKRASLVLREFHEAAHTHRCLAAEDDRKADEMVAGLYSFAETAARQELKPIAP